MPQRARLSRRQFLKSGLAGSALTAVLFTTGSESHMNQCFAVEEENPEISKHLLMIDFAPESCGTDFIQDTYFTDDQLLKRELGKQYIGPFKRYLLGALYKGLNWTGLGGTLEEQFVRNNPHYAIASSALSEVTDHGQGVKHVMWQTVQKLKGDGTGVTPRIYPIQATENINLEQDENGNYILTASARTNSVIHALKFFTEQDIVNLSWQLGKIGITYPEMKRFGAYRKETAVESLRQLFDVCKTFPEKLFFAAAGNYGDDIREARKILADEWPPNVLIIGEWMREKDTRGTEYPRNNVYGADLYAENTGFWEGSSVSTAIISAIAAYLRSFRATHDEIKRKLLVEYSDTVRFVPEEKTNDSHVNSAQTASVFRLKKLLGARYVPEAA
ncbi:MAG: hypothetical protein HY428_02665 [Candidatus Levybacteria bacterium]|nr:hypothetical protein [Candidatus Levybacteria bacterium]